MTFEDRARLWRRIVRTYNFANDATFACVFNGWVGKSYQFSSITLTTADLPGEK